MEFGTAPQLDWRGGATPVATRFDDPYFSLTDGAAEARHVFLGGNGLPERFAPGFRVAELGFGTGLNALVTWEEWEAAGSPGGFSFTSFEAFPMRAADMARALAAWPGLVGKAAQLVAAWERGAPEMRLGPMDLTVIRGDARDTLPRWDGLADAWFLDGFSPARNPELWEPGLMAEVACHTAPGGSFATYTAAGHVRRALAAAGFEVSRHSGFGGKRHMSAGRLGHG